MCQSQYQLKYILTVSTVTEGTNYKASLNEHDDHSISYFGDGHVLCKYIKTMALSCTFFSVVIITYFGLKVCVQVVYFQKPSLDII